MLLCITSHLKHTTRLYMCITDLAIPWDNTAGISGVCHNKLTIPYHCNTGCTPTGWPAKIRVRSLLKQSCKAAWVAQILNCNSTTKECRNTGSTTTRIQYLNWINLSRVLIIGNKPLSLKFSSYATSYLQLEQLLTSVHHLSSQEPYKYYTWVRHEWFSKKRL